MKLEKAIEILREIEKTWDSVVAKEDKDALKLGIKALKVVLDTRRMPGMAGWRVLPGETK